MADVKGGQFSLEWSNFSRFTSNVFRNVAARQEFSDVTLVCGDGHQVAAHKVMLASCSKFFQGILRQNSHPSPLIYLDSIHPDQLDALVAFMYTGEVTIASHLLDEFLTSAQKLKVAGLLEEEQDKVYEEREVNTPRFVKRELKIEQDVVSLEMDVLRDEDQEEEDVNNGRDIAEEEMRNAEEQLLDSEAAEAWDGDERGMLHIEFNSDRVGEDNDGEGEKEEEEEEEEEEIKDVRLKLEGQETAMDEADVSNEEVSCKGEVCDCAVCSTH